MKQSEGIVRVLPVGPIGTNCVLIRPPDSGILYVIDPGGDAEKILSAAGRIAHDSARILLTHGHVDHISAAGVVAAAEGISCVYLHPGDAELYASPENEFPPYLPYAENLPPAHWPPPEDGAFSVIACPGHTPGGSAFYFQEMALVASGDSLFYLSVGRTDFPGGNFNNLMDTLKNRLLHLPGGTRVIPGHGEETNISFEAAHNPYLRS